MSEECAGFVRCARQDLADAVQRLGHAADCDPDPRQREALAAGLQLVQQARDELAPAAVTR